MVRAIFTNLLYMYVCVHVCVCAYIYIYSLFLLIILTTLTTAYSCKGLEVVRVVVSG